jgi:hypothetical protein
MPGAPEAVQRAMCCAADGALDVRGVVDAASLTPRNFHQEIAA